MKYFEPSEQVQLPVLLSISPETAAVLSEMASQMDVTFDELMSALVESEASPLEKNPENLESVEIPDSCSRRDLFDLLKSL